ncbi:TPM domain-containing protein [Dokdonella sp.]|uniref:TPM domain-containing protein n=1 Tax=Dokdonella sp. TaxID=2291710 RepID=UPI0037846E84
MKALPIHLPRLLPFALGAALAACGSDAAPPAVPAKADKPAAVAAAPAVDTRVAAQESMQSPSEAAMIDEIASTLQACSYDGAPVRFGRESVRKDVPGGCGNMVERIMQFTGLPQNFDVVEAPVPNAAAVILLDAQNLPHRVIAFNRDFMDIVTRATGGSRWAPVSIMAHEIGHHLSGHTITPGGSQPPTELEADKFSGFVLYKMGASLADAQKAMATLVADGPDGATHPGRGKRLAAIQEGWKQACAQQNGGACSHALEIAMRSGELDVPAPPDAHQPAHTPVVSEPAPGVAAPRDEAPVAAPAAVARAGADVLPAPGSTPSKFSQFVYDEFGVLDMPERQKAEQRMYGIARDSGVEVVTLLVNDLHGMSAQDYAYAMLRQLRVGKLDVGNGAVVVVAPEQRESAIAIGPGLLIEVGNLQELNLKSLETFIDDAWPVCRKYGNCKGWTQNFFLTSDRIARSGDHWEWTIRFPDLAGMKAKSDADFAERMKTGASYDPDKSATWRKIARYSGTVASLTPDPASKQHFVNAIHAQMVGPAVLVRGDDGSEAMLYVHPHAQALMPSGRLVEGGRYRFVVRADNLDGTPPQLDLLSYDALPPR